MRICRFTVSHTTYTEVPDFWDVSGDLLFLNSIHKCLISVCCVDCVGTTQLNCNLHLHASVCVCHNEKKVPDEWQARQVTQAILQVSSSKHNAKKITTRVRGPFHQSITAILTDEKREEKQFTKPTHVAVYLFRDLDLCVCVSQ